MFQANTVFQFKIYKSIFQKSYYSNILHITIQYINF